MTECNKCFHFKVCKKAENVENYKLQGECGEFVDEELVVVLPCKVYDDIYCFEKYRHHSLHEEFPEATVICSLKVQGFEMFGTDLNFFTEQKRLRGSDIGKSVFFSKKEAEKALSKLQASYEQVKEGAE